MALAADRNTPSRAGEEFVYPVKASVTIYAGALVVAGSDGYARPARVATGDITLGRAEEKVTGSGSDGAVKVRVSRGIFRFDNSSDSDAITIAEIGRACFAASDHAVAKTSGSSTRSPAGIVVDVDADGVWVDTRTTPLALAAGGLAAANNLSDVAAAATARTNLGVHLDHMGDPVIATPGAENSNAINVGIQLRTVGGGADLAVRGAVYGYLSDDANGDSIVATAPDGGIAIGTDGLLIPIVAGKAFLLVSEADGDIDVTITHAGGAKTLYLILVTPRGKLVASAAIAFT